MSAALLSVVDTGALLPATVMHAGAVRVLQAFVTINTVMYCALAVAKILPRLHPSTWLRKPRHRAEERGIHPAAPARTPDAAPAAAAAAGPAATAADGPRGGAVHAAPHRWAHAPATTRSGEHHGPSRPPVADRRRPDRRSTRRSTGRPGQGA
ncbi:hypothetical protein [Cellulomonas aerilata]|uniref:Uncharacterized protein n=1 Tax=Cellulomonas aerilata TaxID=515326 RepID=A0A512DAI0_9CELL|nr:hypothetical protein [Cellulomonas aerilata]GEO33488.1 hypothetical protein CAE01nite_12130 [Cellulomonas aerilata]